MKETLPQRLPFFYGWVVVAVTFVTMGIGVNARTAFSLFYPPILSEFGWERGVTAGAFSFGFVVSGALVMEIVFSYPGVGLLLLDAVTSTDYPLMQAIFLVITFAVLLANLAVDLVIVFFDPRVRAREAAR